MSINSRILDGLGQGYEARVDNFHSLWVRDIGVPPASDPNNPSLNFNEIQTVYREFLTLNGNGVTTSAISSTASLSNQLLYYVAAEPGFDIYVTSLSITVQAPGTTLAGFGGRTNGLTNGLKFYYEGPNGQIVIGDNLRTQFEIVRLCQGNPAFSDPSSGAFIAKDISGSTEAFYQVLDFTKVFGLPYGVRLNVSSVNKLVMVVKDDTSGSPGSTTLFEVIAYGTRVKIT